MCARDLEGVGAVKNKEANVEASSGELLLNVGENGVKVLES